MGTKKKKKERREASDWRTKIEEEIFQRTLFEKEIQVTYDIELKGNMKMRRKKKI